MTRLSAPCLALLGLAWALLAPAPRAQCPDWEPVGPYPGADGPIFAFAAHDDGSGPKLYAGGRFGKIAEFTVEDLARWDGTTWEPVGGGVSHPTASGEIQVLRALDLGSGPELYAGGRFTQIGGVPANSIARWDGSQWWPLGGGLSGLEVNALEVFDDGSGPALYAGGNFSQAGSVSVSNLARWDGTTWSDPGQAQGIIDALQVFDDGSGPALYAGGGVLSIAGVTVNGIARLDGTGWSALGSGLTGLLIPQVRDLAVFDDGSGPALYLCGRFNSANGVSVRNIAKWDGTTFSKLGSGLSSNSTTVDVRALEVLDDGSGSALYAGGQIVGAGGVSVRGVARWDGVAWSSLGKGVVGDNPLTMGVYALGSYGVGGSEQLLVGGFIAAAGDVGARCIARWDGSDWHGWGGGFDYRVLDLALHDDGTGAALYACGQFEIAGGAIANMVARLGPGGWEGLDFPWGHGTAVSLLGLDALASFDDGGGPGLFVAGHDSYDGILWMWRGGLWTYVKTFDESIYDMVAFDDGSGAALYVGGGFTKVGGASARGVARFDGTSWTEVGGGILGAVHALAAFDGGGGLELYAGGAFTQAGSVPALRIARWDGSSWRALVDPAGGLSGTGQHFVRALAVHDDGSGPALYVAGWFQDAGPTSARNVARWDGVAWSALGAGVGSGNLEHVEALASYDDGTGSRLFVGGGFDDAGGQPAANAAAWDGTSWTPLPLVQSSGLGYDSVDTLLSFDLGEGPHIAAGGLFDTVGGQPSPDLAFWRGCPDASLALSYCSGDGSIAPCACGNQVPPGTQAGCANSTGQGGLLTASGNVSVALSDLALTASQLPPGMPGIVISAPDKAALPFGDGLLCVGTPFAQLPVAFADPAGTFSVRGVVSQLAAAAGQTRAVQAWYRDPNGPCGATFNLTNALAITFTP